MGCKLSSHWTMSHMGCAFASNIVSVIGFVWSSVPMTKFVTVCHWWYNIESWLLQSWFYHNDPQLTQCPLTGLGNLGICIWCVIYSKSLYSYFTCISEKIYTWKYQIPFKLSPLCRYFLCRVGTNFIYPLIYWWFNLVSKYVWLSIVYGLGR